MTDTNTPRSTPTDEPTYDHIDGEVVDRLSRDPETPFPERRSPADVAAHRDTLLDELAVVADRHTGDMTAADIVLVLFEFADSYRRVYDVEMAAETVHPPGDTDEDRSVDMLRIPDATADPPITPINDRADALTEGQYDE